MICKQYVIIAILSILIFAVTVEGTYAQSKSTQETAGDIIQIVIPAAAYVATFATDDHEGRNQFYKSFFTNLGVTYGLKVTVNKPRQQNNGDYSFPSGHTSASFQGAVFIHRRYGFKYSIPAYLGAAYVGWSRVEGESDKHDFTDVAAGAAIGASSAYFFTTRHKDFRIVPEITNNFWGLRIVGSW